MFSKVILSLSYFLIRVTKYPQRQHKEGRVYLDSLLEGIVHHGRTVKALGV